MKNKRQLYANIKDLTVVLRQLIYLQLIADSLEGCNNIEFSSVLRNTTQIIKQHELYPLSSMIVMRKDFFGKNNYPRLWLRGPGVRKISAINVQNVSINYICWISIGNISTISPLLIMSPHFLPLSILGNFQNFQIVAAVFKPFSFHSNHLFEE